MTQQQLIDQLLALSDTTLQKQLLADHINLLGKSVIDACKGQADQFLRAEIQRSFDYVSLLLYMGELTSETSFRAWGLLAEGNAFCIGLGEYQRSLASFDMAHRLFHQQEDAVGQARVEIGRMVAFVYLGNYEQAVASGEWACRVFAQAGCQRLLATTTLNLGIIHCRQGDDAKALAFYEQAEGIYRGLGLENSGDWAWVQQNRAASLRNLGQFAQAISVSKETYQHLLEVGQTIEAARAQQNLAHTYYLLGHYNESLQHFDQAYTTFCKDQRQRDAILVELFMSDCLLQLRRFGEVLDKCQRVRALFGERGVQEVAAQAIVNEAIAFTHLNRFAEALASLQEAKQIFSDVGNKVWLAMTEMESAAVLYRQKNYAECIEKAQQASEIFQAHELIVEAAHAYLIRAQALLGLNRVETAKPLVLDAIRIGEARNLPSLSHQGYRLLGVIAEAQQCSFHALEQYERAIVELERMRGRLMLEHRANFLEDKQDIYESAVRLALKIDQPDLGLEYAERSKSRVLLDLVAYRLNLNIEARQTADQPLVQELLALRSQRDRLYRRWESNEELKVRGWLPSSEQHTKQQEILSLEARITELWHKLLVHNADYAREAALWQIRTESIQPYLPANTLLLEYYVVEGNLILFLVTPKSVRACQLSSPLTHVQRLLQLLQVNLNTAARCNPAQVAKLTHNAQGLLKQLYQALLSPVEEALRNVSSLIIVPHGPLHYLPFHALYDGDAYLIEQYEVSYLPGSSLLRYCREVTPTHSDAFIYGCSYQGRLPNTLDEATAIAKLLQTEVYLEDALGVEAMQAKMSQANIVHLATHGEFRQDNPLFSGLLLGESWLTTLDIFNLRLNASLITLSGCQTGRNAIQGGDELAGLMRAFLSVGAKSLLLSFWPVEDRTTAYLMKLFYQHLMQGTSKGAALRAAQLQMIHACACPERATPFMNHPYFWSPFFLVGDAGTL